MPFIQTQLPSLLPSTLKKKNSLVKVTKPSLYLSVEVVVRKGTQVLPWTESRPVILTVL